MTTKIIVTGEALLKLLDGAAAVELSKSATAQVAEQLKRKIDKGGFADKIFSDVEADLKRRFGNQYSLPEGIQSALREAAKMAIDRAVGERLQKTVEVACGEAQKEIDGRIGDIIAKKFSDLVRAAAAVRR